MEAEQNRWTSITHLKASILNSFYLTKSYYSFMHRTKCFPFNIILLQRTEPKSSFSTSRTTGLHIMPRVFLGSHGPSLGTPVGCSERGNGNVAFCEQSTGNRTLEPTHYLCMGTVQQRYRTSPCSIHIVFLIVNLIAKRVVFAQ